MSYSTPTNYIYTQLTKDQIELLKRLDETTVFPIVSQFLDRSLNGIIHLVADSTERLAIIPTDGFVVLQLDNNTLYRYNSNTSSWVTLSGGSGGMAIGGSVIGGTAGSILYIDATGNLTEDSQFTRDDGVEKQTDIESNTYAQLSVNDGLSESQIQADNVGASGNLITLTFDGIIDVNQAILDWNTANPSNTCSLISGTGTEVIPAGTEALVGGGTTGFQSGAFNVIPIGAVQGSGNYGIDVTNNNVAFNVAGNLTTAFGQPTMGIFNGFFSLSNGAYFLSAVNGQTELFASDFSTFQASISVDQFNSALEFNGNRIEVNDFNFTLEDGTGRFEIPVGQTPVLGDALRVTGISGSTYTVEFAPVATASLPNGNKPFQLWNWNDAAATQDWYQVFILTQENAGDSNVFIGQDAGALSETGYAGYANTIIGTSAAQSLSSGTSSEISRNVVIGTYAVSTTSLMENSIILGYQSFSGGTDQIIQSIIMTPDTTGASTGQPITNSIAIGYGAKIHGDNNISIGQSAAAGITDAAEDSVIIGSAAAGSGGAFYRDTILGANGGSGYTSGGRNTFLGFGTSGPGSVSQSIALGNQAQVNADHQMAIGGIAGTVPDGAIYDIRFNNGVTDLGGEKYTFKYPDVITSITNGAGNQVEFYAGRGTGNAAGSEFNFYVSLPTTSGTTQHSHYLGLRLLGTFASVGDVGGIQNGTILTVDDDVSTINAITDGNFNVKDTSGNQIVLAQPTSKAVTIGDVDLAGSQNYFKVDDSNNDSRMVLGDNGIYIIRGGVGGGAHIMFSANVSESRIEIRDTRFQEDKGNDVASSNDLTLGGDGNCFTITGTTTINAITTANWRAGSQITLIFASNPTVKHNTAGGAGTARMFLAGSVDLAAQTNTVLGLIYDGTQWQETFRKTP